MNPSRKSVPVGSVNQSLTNRVIEITYLAHAGILSLKKLPLEPGSGRASPDFRLFLRFTELEDSLLRTSDARERKVGGFASLGLTSSSVTMRIVEPVPSRFRGKRERGGSNTSDGPD